MRDDEGSEESSQKNAKRQPESSIDERARPYRILMAVASSALERRPSIDLEAKLDIDPLLHKG